ncbi:MAG: PAS domain-containing protein [Armatimonadetes bacterium]|nr:PAS domain-containing protein [Armatimonadota bacterium]
MSASPALNRELLQEYRAVKPTGVERKLGPEEVIVSKTDTKGHITYANHVFCRIAGYTTEELMGAPHSIVRHPDMPRCVFKLLWDVISAGNEIFAYVKNMARNGDHYWVFAHVTPTFNAAGEIVGYHSNRRCPDRKAVELFEGLYKALRDIENSIPDRRIGLETSFNKVLEILESKGVSYDEFIFSVTPN